MLLSHVGELGLTDAQVVRLAAIARRQEARRQSLRAALDSAERRFQPGDSIARRQFGERMRANMEREQEQIVVDQRDALAVLNADQQARAWSMATGPARGFRGRGGPGMRPGGMGRGMRRPEMGRREMRRPGMRRPEIGPGPGMRPRRDGFPPGRPVSLEG
jgi:hypothetical protein